MKSDLQTFLNACVEFLIVSCVVALVSGLLFVDVALLKDGISEISFVEITQELFLLASAVLFFRQARRRKELRAGLILVGGFVLCMFIRELDAFFDLLAHGSWFWFAIAVAAGCIIYALIHPTAALRGLADVVNYRGYAMMLAGFVCVLVFSRLFGMHVLWRDLLDQGYVRTVKNAVEEGTELLGYSLILLSTLGYVYRRDKN